VRPVLGVEDRQVVRPGRQRGELESVVLHHPENRLTDRQVAGDGQDGEITARRTIVQEHRTSHGGLDGHRDLQLDLPDWRNGSHLLLRTRQVFRAGDQVVATLRDLGENDLTAVIRRRRNDQRFAHVQLNESACHRLAIRVLHQNQHIHQRIDGQPYVAHGDTIRYLVPVWQKLGNEAIGQCQLIRPRCQARRQEQPVPVTACREDLSRRLVASEHGHIGNGDIGIGRYDMADDSIAQVRPSQPNFESHQVGQRRTWHPGCSHEIGVAREHG
jgi:hypothetical protein